MKKIQLYIIAALILLSCGMVQGNEFGPKSYTGVVLNKKTNRPIVRCKVFVKGTEVGTITNNDGEFSIKVKKEDSGKDIVFSALGYATYEAKSSKLAKTGNRIILLPISRVLDEVIIRDPKDLLIEALSKISDNYPTSSENLTAFYRETVKKNRKYVDISQGSINIKKTSYKSYGTDKARIEKGYRNMDYKALDTLVFKLKGGVRTMLYLDVVKHPGQILSNDVIEHYNYELNDIVWIDQKLNYEIGFAPKPNRNVPLYTGKIYVEGESLGISGMSFGFLGNDLKEATKTLVKKKPSLAKVYPIKVWYDIEYRKSGDKWYQYYTKSSLDMKINWKKKLFNSTFFSNSEMVVTDRRKGTPAPPIERQEALRSNHIFSEVAEKISDEEFWASHNIIKPEDDLKKAIAKINKKKGKQ